MPFCTRDLSIADFGIPGGPGTSPPWVPRDDCIDGLSQNILVFIQVSIPVKKNSNYFVVF